MRARFIGPTVLRQAALASFDGEGFFWRVEPKVAFSGADAAIAGLGIGDLRDCEGELEGGAMAVAIVGFERSSRHVR